MRWLGAVLFVVACSDSAAPDQGTAIALSSDERGTPRLLQAQGSPAATARAHVERLAPKWGVTGNALPVLRELGAIPVRGGSIARIAQEIDGLPVYGGELRVLVRDTGELATVGGTLRSTRTARSKPHFKLDEAGAIARAVEYAYFGAKDVHVDEAMARRMWYPVGDKLVASWVIDSVTSRASTNGDGFRTVLEASTGRVISHRSLVADAAFTYSVFADATTKHPFDGPIADSTPHPTGTPNGFYPPYLSGPSLVSVESLSASGDPWLADGATETRGNNVNAYADLSAPDGLTNGDFRATVTEPGKFGHVYNTAVGPLSSQQQQMAAITSLFYVMNWLHDFWYDAGFNETAGNAQDVNFGRGGVEGDALRGEAQDNANGGSRNNANMLTPADGMSPRMQVFLWSGKDDRSLALSPSNRTPAVGSASFGLRDFDITGELIVGTDGAGPNPTDGCTALTNNVAGKIVVVDRGNCKFKAKAVNVQSAGGIGMLLVNDTTSSSPPGMGDAPEITTAITIGLLSVTMAEGAQIKSDIAAGTVTATLHRKQFQDLDGSLDATLIAHEFGHYLHHRLSICENRLCGAMSEGWGDFIALLLLAKDGDNLDGAFPFSVYTTQSFSADPAYYGIRRAPYSTSFSINALMFRHMADGVPTPTNHPFNASNVNSEVHNAGEVWAAALWDGYIALQKAGTSFSDVRKKMAQYVVAGLLLAPIQASVTETRDAILAAVLASSREDHDLLMAAFARRGFGSCAVSPPGDSLTFTELEESTLIAGNPQVQDYTLADTCDEDGVLDNGETATLRVRVANQGHAALTDVQIVATSQLPGVTIVSPPVQLAKLEQFETHDLAIEVKLDGADNAIAGDLAVQIIATGACVQSVAIPVAFRLNIDDKPMSSAIDTFDTAKSVWDPWVFGWSQIRETPLDGAWYGEDMPITSDVRLTSPMLLASSTEPLVIRFQHKYSFEAEPTKKWDGGVLEYSTDDGETWLDVATIVDPGYTGTITNESGNPLGDRNAFTDNNPSWPEVDTVRLDFGTALAGQNFKFRFRIGTDAGTGAPGWTIDEVAFQGIVGTPFPTQVVDDGVCAPIDPDDDPIVSGGGGCCDAGNLDGANALLALGVLGLVLRRRRRR